MLFMLSVSLNSRAHIMLLAALIAVQNRVLLMQYLSHYSRYIVFNCQLTLESYQL